MKIGTESFRGEAPRVTPRGLPDNASQDATNARLVTGDATAWGQLSEVETLARTAPVQTISLMAGEYWLSFEEEVDVARGVIPGDDTYRTYLTGLDAPRFTNLAMATTGGPPYPVDTRLLGVPSPDSAPTVAAGIDPTPTTFAIDVLDEGDKLATDWTVNSPLTGSTYATVTQNAIVGDPAPSYRCDFDENHDPGTEAWALRNFGVAGVSVLEVNANFMTDSKLQACLNVACTQTGAGITVLVSGGGIGIGKRLEAGAVYGLAPVSGTACVITAGVWYRMQVSVALNDAGTKTVTARVYDASDVLVAETVGTSTFDDGDWCGFANGTPDDAGGHWVTYYDNYHVQATGSTNYVPVNTATSYVYTFVNDLGEESAPSTASATVLRPDGVAITVTTPAGVPTGTDPDYGITTKRIYRAATGSSGTVFLFVAEIPLATTEYVDSIPDTELGEALESEDWDLPPSDLRGILALPNGVMVGFRRNQLCFSAQNRPHAWPVRYRLNTDTDIVGIGNIDTTVVIGTESFPYVASGNDPAAYSMAKFEVPQACVSKRSFAYLTGIGVVFASPDGLIAVSGVGQVRNLTETIFTREQWQALRPESIISVAHDDVYHFFYDTVAPTPPPPPPPPPPTVAWDVDRSSADAVFSDEDLTAESTNAPGEFVNVITTGSGKTTGKYYYEFEIVTVAGFNSRSPAFGLVTDDHWEFPPSPPVGEIGVNQWGFRCNGAKALGGSDLPVFFSPALVSGDVVGIAVDLDAGKMWVSRNGVFDGDPAAGTGAAYTDLLSKAPFPVSPTNPAYPSASVGENDSLGKLTARFAEESWTYSAPAGFGAWEL